MGSEARTRLGLAALLFTTLLGFSRVFEEGDYPGPALLGALLATGITMLTRRIGLSTWASLLASGAALVWYLVQIFESSRMFYGLPTPNAVTSLIASVRRAYEHSAVDYAPVPLRPGYVILTVGALWMLATVGEVATFRWRRPLVPAVAAAALFSFLLILGVAKGSAFLAFFFLVGILTYLGLEADHRLRAWGRWVSAWSAKNWDTESTTGPLARRMGASCLAAALIAPMFLPSIGTGILTWRNATGPGGISGRIDTLVSLAPRLVQQSNQVLFSVSASEPAYWRLITLTYFDGETWHPKSSRAEVSGDAIASQVREPEPGRRIAQRYEIRGLEGEFLPAVSLPTAVRFVGPSAEDFEGELGVNPLTADLELARSLEQGVAYNVQSVVPDVTFKSMHDAAIPDVESFGEELPPYLPIEAYQVPRDFCPGFEEGQPDCERLRESPIFRIAKRWTKGADSPFEKLLALQERFRARFVHELPGAGDVPVRPEASAEYLTSFLTERRVGYCQQFATAFAVLARMLGYPTRVAVGFLPGETGIAQPNSYTVRGNDAHAWPEVFFDELGWVAFEPTPRGSAPPPAYTSRRPAPGGAAVPQVGAGPVRGQARGVAALPRGLQDSRFAQSGRASREPRRPDPADWRGAFLRLTLVLLVFSVAFLIAVPATKEWWTRRQYHRATDPDARAEAAFAHFEREARDLASPRARAETASTYVGRLREMRVVPNGPAVRLADLFEAAVYSSEALSPEEADEAVGLVRRLRKELWAEAGWWQRVGRLFSPAPLLEEIRLASGAGRLQPRLRLASRP